MSNINRELFYNFIHSLLINSNKDTIISKLDKEAIWIDDSLPYQPEISYNKPEEITKMLSTTSFPHLSQKDFGNIEYSCKYNDFNNEIECVCSNIPIDSNDEENSLKCSIKLKSKHLENSIFYVRTTYYAIDNSIKGGVLSFNYDKDFSLKYISDELASFLSFRNKAKLQFSCNSTLSCLITSDDKIKLSKAIKESLITREKFSVEFGIIDSLFNRKSIVLNAQTIEGNDNLFIIGAITKIENNHTTDLIMKKIIPQFLTMLQYFEQPVFWKDKYKKYQGFNSGFLEYCEDKRYTSIVGKNDLELFGKDKSTEFSSSDNDLLSGKIKFANDVGTISINNKTTIYRSYKIPLYINNKIEGTLGFIFNLTQEKNYKSQIKNTAHLYNYMFENSNIAYCIKDSEKTIVLTNKQFLQSFLNNKATNKNEHFSFLNHEQLKLLNECEGKVVKEKKQCQIDYVNIFNYQQNKNIFYKILITPILDDYNNIYRLIIKFDDLTKELEREKQIIKSYNKSLDLLSTSSNISYLRIDLETKEILFSRLQNSEINTNNIKYTKDLLFSRRNLFVYDFEFEDFYKKFSAESLDKSYDKNELLINQYSLRFDNKFYEFSIKTEYNLNPFTQHREAVLIIADVTDIIRANDIIVNFSEKEYDFIAILSMYADVVDVFYQNKKEIDFSSIKENPTINNFFETLFKIIKAKKTDIHYIHSIINNVLKTQKPDYLLIETDSGIFKNITITTLNNTKKLSVIVVCKDLTEINKKEMEIQRELKTLADNAIKTNKRNADFLSRISHDMRTPLNSILGLSNLGLEESKNKSCEDYYKKIASSSRYLSLLLNEIVELQKIEEGNFSLNLSHIYTLDLQEKILNIINPKLKEKNISIDIIQENKAPSYIFCDEKRIIDVISNLLINAINYSNSNSSIVWKYKYIKRPKLRIQHTISDNGVAMDNDFQKKMAKKLNKPNSTNNISENEKGLGLTVINSLLNAMGGTISYRSEYNGTTTFTVNIPFTISSSEQYEEQNSKKKYVNRSSLNDKKILLCEDNFTNTIIVKKLLSEYKIEVDVAKNGIEALKKVNSNNYDAILMDIMMPVMDGIETTAQIRKNNRDIPIIALSANANDVDYSKSIECGMNDHIIKPIDKDVLYDTLASYIK